jgi:hypothetical protein
LPQAHPARIATLATIILLKALPLAAQASQPEALKDLRAAVDSEFRADRTDKSIWIYKDREDSSEKHALYIQIETREGSLRRLIELDGHPLSPDAAKAETERINDFVHDPSARARAHKNAQHDDAQAAEMMHMLPDAFIWTITSQNSETITLHFIPNPKFDPPDMQSRVMGMMGGEMIIVRDGNRIRTLRGALTEDIRFGYGLFGHLDRGGTFDIERRQVGDGHWQITESHVHIGGKALLFKTIGQQEDEVKTDWKSSNSTTLDDAARILNSQH